MSGWWDCKLGDVSLYVNRGISPKYVESFGIPVINQKCIKDGVILKNFLKYHSEDKRHTQEKKLIKGDILINSTGVGTAGRVGIFLSDNYFLVDSHITILRVNKKMAIPEFIFYNLRGREHEIEGYAEGSTGQIELGREKVKQINMLLPSLPEQKAIAAVLSSLDDKIDLLHRQNKTLEAMAETLFKQWFVVEAEEDWEQKPLKEVVNIGIGRTPPRQQHQWFSTNSTDIQWVSIKDLGDGGVYIFKTSEYLTQAAVEQFNIPIIPENTVILSFKMTVGRVAITTSKMLSNEAIAHFKFTEKIPFTQEYLYLFLKNFKYDLLGSTSSIVTSINSAMIKDMEIAVPNDKIMKKFKEITKSLFFKIRGNQTQIQTLEALRDTLLPKLMSGEIRVNIR